MTFIGLTIQGLEKAAEKETGGKFYSNGKVAFEKLEKKEFYTLSKVYELITSFKFKNLKEIISNTQKIKLNLTGTYKCLCKRSGEHDFNSMILEQEAGNALGKSNQNLNYSRDEPQNIIIFDISEKNCNVGILKKVDLVNREYRFKLHSQTTPPLIASCLIKYLDIKKSESLVCLESKDGVIPIEASFQGIKNILAQDTHSNNIRNAKINAKLAKKDIEFLTDSLNNLPKEKKDYIITQIIFSKEKKGPYKLIHDVFELAEKILKKDLAIITNHVEDIDSFSSKKMKLKEKIKIKYKKSESFILIYSKN
tara:strand:- start:3347 stop:4273 length:927 start_codon:yes stop_codon:yes gene_type:complete